MDDDKHRQCLWSVDGFVGLCHLLHDRLKDGAVLALESSSW